MNYQYENPTPAGIPVLDTMGNVESYSGLPVTLRGANGYTVSGALTLNYPEHLPEHLHQPKPARLHGCAVRLPGRRRPDRIRRTLGPPAPAGGLQIRRRARSQSFLLFHRHRGPRQLLHDARSSGRCSGRFFYSVGSGLEQNAVYGFAATPRLSGAYYLLKPSTASFFNGTKLHSSFSKGIKGPSIYVQNNSLAAVLTTSGSGNLVAQYGIITPPNAENSRSYDGGVDQEFGRGRARLGLTYFHNEYTNVSNISRRTRSSNTLASSTTSVPYFTVPT